MKIMKFKKPRYIGLQADLIGVQVKHKHAEYREPEIRKAIGRSLLGKPVQVLLFNGHHLILTDPAPKTLPEGFEYAGEALIQWMGENGEVLIQFVK